MRKILRMPVTHAKTVMLVMVALLALSAIGAKNLYFRGDYNIFFKDNNPQLQAFNEIQATFSKTDNIAIVIAPASGNVFNEQTLSLIRDITNESWQIPYASRVDSISNFQYTFAEQDDLIVEDLLADYYPLTQDRINTVEQAALAEPLLNGSLVSNDGKVAVVNVTIQQPDIDKTAEIIDVNAYARSIVAKHSETHPDTAFHLAGIMAMNQAFNEAAQADTETLIPMMLLIVLVFLTLMLRSILSVLSTLIIIISSVVATLGLAGWAGMYMTMTTVNVPTLILTIAVADCVHVVATMRQRMRLGETKPEAVAHSISINWLPIIITSVTTAIGFLMMNFSDSPALQQLGNLAAVGIIIACVLSLTLLPAMLKLLPIRPLPKRENDENTLMDRFGLFVINNRKVLLPVSVVVVALCAALIPQNRVNDEATKYFDHSSPFRQAVDFMEDNISGMDNISIAVKTGQPQGIADPEFLALLQDFTDWLRIQPEVDHVASLTDIFKRLNKNMHGDDESYYRLPTNRELASQYLLLYEMSLPYGLDLNNQINVDKSSVRLSVTLNNLGSKELLDIESRIYDWFSNYAPHLEVSASSPTMMFAHIGETNMSSMLKSLPITLVLISALLIFSLRSFKLGVISLVPNMAPAIIGFGLWAVFSGEINLGLSVVVTLTLGIVVDDAVHFLSKYQYARNQGQSAEQAVRYAFNTVGRALWITTIVLVAGFLVLASSSFRLNSDMGQLSAMIVFLALVVDFVMLPTLLLKFDNKEETQTSSQLTQVKA